ncbi:hypothetical protein [Aliirhizobium cellulosilyticum]|uniref:SpoVG family protein n=1 Tax=Aliirhizobium cellulosilyticum TaxID=393664 RepID=A0A7W6UTW1_9HYPH|nr:hypothetical protein [Rhizobium cellulosilyticum]MBB4348015.1 hypothetical protein [Rhizobium cellulosilyticum]MBB4409591.1 hypothetical protein [Rhizobium cellulosilyticum]MBB4444280.1 hypothetical protein [Rhizobium cellulosilyticum]
MQITDFKTIDEPSGGHRAIAVFDLELTDECRLYGLRLLRMRDGRLLTFAPQSGYRRVASFATPLAERITRLALDQYEALTAYDRIRAA